MRKGWFALLTLGLLTLVALAPATMAVPAAVRPTAVISTEGTASQFSASATWNGISIASASTPGSAISASFGSPATVNFTWFTGASPTANATSPFAITDAILHIVYLGQAVWTKDQAFSPPLSAGSGSYSLSADLTATRYLVEGLFQVQAVLLSNTQGAVWTQTFFVNVVAPYHFTVAVLALGLLAIYELVSLARVGPLAVPKPKVGTTTSTPPASPPTPPETPPSTEAPK
jgi:hypothetical protein